MVPFLRVLKSCCLEQPCWFLIRSLPFKCEITTSWRATDVFFCTLGGQFWAETRIYSPFSCLEEAFRNGINTKSFQSTFCLPFVSPRCCSLWQPTVPRHLRAQPTWYTSTVIAVRYDLAYRCGQGAQLLGHKAVLVRFWLTVSYGHVSHNICISGMCICQTFGCLGNRKPGVRLLQAYIFYRRASLTGVHLLQACISYRRTSYRRASLC